MDNWLKRLLTSGLGLLLLLSLVGCSLPAPVAATERLFLPLSLDLLAATTLPRQEFQETPVGGLSAITYDRERDRFYALSDDRSRLAPARFYTLHLTLAAGELTATVEGVTLLRNQDGETFPADSLDPEGIALSPRGTLFISSEGVAASGAAPFVGEFDLNSGQLRQFLPLPSRFLPPDPSEADPERPQGIRGNLGFEALTLAAPSVAAADPFRLFTAPESTLAQDLVEAAPAAPARIRLLHYGVNPVGPPVLIAEMLYRLEPGPDETLANSLTSLLALEREGFLLSLERTFGLGGFGAKIFQLVPGNATDTSRIATLAGSLSNVEPIRKQLLLDLQALDLTLDNLEGMTLGPRFPDGSRSLILISDDNFSDRQVTQILAFRLASP